MPTNDMYQVIRCECGYAGYYEVREGFSATVKHPGRVSHGHKKEHSVIYKLELQHAEV